MKKISLILLVFLFVSLYSCDKDAQTDLKITNSITEDSGFVENEYMELYNDIISSNINNQKQIVNSFNYRIQSALWKLKLNNFIENNSLDTKQIEALSKWESLLTSDNLKRARKGENTELIYKIKNLKNEILSSFKKNTAWYLINKFENVNQTLEKIKLIKTNENQYSRAAVVYDCDCVHSSDCVRITGVSWIGVQWEYGACVPKNCYASDGIFGLFANNNNRLCVY